MAALSVLSNNGEVLGIFADYHHGGAVGRESHAELTALKFDYVDKSYVARLTENSINCGGIKLSVLPERSPLMPYSPLPSAVTDQSNSMVFDVGS